MTTKLYNCFNKSMGDVNPKTTFIETIFNKQARFQTIIKKSGNGVILRNLLDDGPGQFFKGIQTTESLDDMTSFRSVPGSYWHNGICSMNMVYPADPFTENNWSIPVIFAAAYGGNCNIVTELTNSQISNTSNWSNIYNNQVFGTFNSWNDLSNSKGVYYANDANASDGREKLINVENDSVVYSGWGDDPTQYPDDAIKLTYIENSNWIWDKESNALGFGSGGYGAGMCTNGIDNLSCGGGTGLHSGGPTWGQWYTNPPSYYGNYDGSVDVSRANLTVTSNLTIYKCLTNSFNFIKTYISAAQKVPGCDLDCVGLWDKDLLTLMNIQNGLWFNRNIKEGKLVSKLGQETAQWNGFKSSFWGWSEVPIPTNSLGKISFNTDKKCYEFGWDALVIYLPLVKQSSQNINWPSRSVKPTAVSTSNYTTSSLDNAFALHNEDVYDLLNQTEFSTFRLTLYKYINRITCRCFSKTAEYYMKNDIATLKTLLNELKFTFAYQYDVYVDISRNKNTKTKDIEYNYDTNATEKVFQRYFFNITKPIDVVICPWEFNMYGYNQLFTEKPLNNNDIKENTSYSYPNNIKIIFTFNPQSGGFCNLSLNIETIDDLNNKDNLIDYFNNSLDNYNRIYNENNPAFMDVSGKGLGIMARQLFDTAPGMWNCFPNIDSNSMDDNDSLNVTPGTYLHNFMLTRNKLYPIGTLANVLNKTAAAAANMPSPQKQINNFYDINYNSPIFVASVAGGIESSNNKNNNWNRIFSKDTFGNFNNFDKVINEGTGVFYPLDANSADYRLYYDGMWSYGRGRYIGWNETYEEISGVLVSSRRTTENTRELAETAAREQPEIRLKQLQQQEEQKNNQGVRWVYVNNSVVTNNSCVVENSNNFTIGSGSLMAGSNNGGGTGPHSQSADGPAFSTSKPCIINDENIDSKTNRFKNDILNNYLNNYNNRNIIDFENCYKAQLTIFKENNSKPNIVDFYKDFYITWVKNPLDLISFSNFLWKNRVDVFNYNAVNVSQVNKENELCNSLDSVAWGWSEVPLQKNVLGNNRELGMDAILIHCPEPDILSGSKTLQNYLQNNQYFFTQLLSYYTRFFYLWDDMKFIFSTIIPMTDISNELSNFWQTYCFVPKEKNNINLSNNRTYYKLYNKNCKY